MKKLIYFLMAVLVTLAAVSCKKDNSGSNADDGKVPVPEAVDIGLVVNGKTIKWASFNLGASKEYEYGNHYAWGETEPKSNYDWTTYLLANGNEEKLIAYCPRNKADYWDSDVKPNGPDGEEKLLPSHDAAHAKLGGEWRMPTLEEFEALLALKEDTDNYDCNFWALVIDENGNEIRDANGDVVHGFRITQKSTGNSIFFPAAGYYLQDRLLKTAAEGPYWSSTLDTDNPSYAFYVCFQPADAYSVSYPRLYGRSIRPVCEE